VAERFYSANLSRDKNRNAFALTFRHPVRIDPQTGKPGRKVRRGLGTSDERAASALVAQMNEILSSPEWWEIGQRQRAEERYSPIVVEAFYDGIASENRDWRSLRNETIRLPGSEDGYRSAVFVGTTGAGKTTLLRQIIGTRRERFPSTSTSRTTVADTEIVVNDESSYRAVVTFQSRFEVRTLVEESLFWAFLAACEGLGRLEIKQRLLNHVSQRFRLGYTIGSKTSGDALPDADASSSTILHDSSDDPEPNEDDDLEINFEVFDETEATQIATEERTKLDEFVDATAGLAERLRLQVETTLPKEESDIEDIVRYEEGLESAFRDDEEAHEIVDEIMDEIEKRFEGVPGHFTKSRAKWPLTWQIETEDRSTFFDAIELLSSNSSGLHGRLLTPLINGMRVSGPFRQKWMKPQKIVLYDVEGLGHSADTATTIPPSLVRLLGEVDSIVLVDNAAQSMLSVPQIILKSVVTSGMMSRLIMCFTHFDQVAGDNLPTVAERKRHVFSTVDNALREISAQTSASAKLLRERLRDHCYYLSEMQKGLKQKDERETRERQREIFTFIRDVAGERRSHEGLVYTPSFDKTQLVLGIGEAIREYVRRWEVMLGLERRDPFLDEDRRDVHWTRIKALTRRLGEMGGEGYYELQPVSELFDLLKNGMYAFINRAAKWGEEDLTESDKQFSLESLMESMTSDLMAISTRRIREERIDDWKHAYLRSGPGSTFLRAKDLDILLSTSAPIPTFLASASTNSLLREILMVLDNGIERQKERVAALANKQ
jgi:GTPase Era involved in 16S rRNA processing